MDPEERRRRFQERMASMTPEERAQMAQRFGNRQGGGGEQGGQRGGARQGGPSQADAVALTGAAGQTIDSLFGPLPSVIGSGRVYQYIDKQMKQARVRTGITDGTYTELIGEELKEGQELVTDVSTGQARATTPMGPGQQRPGQSTNPLMPGGGRGGPGIH
jgi:HlyD family secretion protein